MNKCVIFAGGQIKGLSSVDCGELEESFVICADKGLEYAKALGIAPDLVLGDFDSLGSIPEFSGMMKKFPCEKDDTDLMLAIKYALKNNLLDITVYGALGGRLDHTLGNIQSLAYIAENGGRGKIVSENELCRLVLPGKYYIESRHEYSLSLLAYSEKVTGLTIKGAKYPLLNGEITSSFPVGISNVITEKNCEISFESGKLLIIQSNLITDF